MAKTACDAYCLVPRQCSIEALAALEPRADRGEVGRVPRASSLEQADGLLDTAVLDSGVRQEGLSRRRCACVASQAVALLAAGVLAVALPLELRRRGGGAARASQPGHVSLQAVAGDPSQPAAGAAAQAGWPPSAQQSSYLAGWPPAPAAEAARAQGGIPALAAYPPPAPARPLPAPAAAAQGFQPGLVLPASPPKPAPAGSPGVPPAGAAAAGVAAPGLPAAAVAAPYPPPPVAAPYPPPVGASPAWAPSSASADDLAALAAADPAAAAAAAAGASLPARRPGGSLVPLDAPQQPGAQTTGGCSDKGADCSSTQCCATEGYQCYTKDAGWATCLPKCPSTGWDCTKLGSRTPLKDPDQCSAPGDNCGTTKCCTEPGTQCYAMDESAFWASCAYDCKPGVDWASNWTCEELGERAEDGLGCAWSGKACTFNKLCCHEGQQCIRKNVMEAYCSHEEPPEDWDGEVLGGCRNEYIIGPVSEDEARGTSLFCFMAVLPGSFEEGLRDLAAGKGASIFACDASASYGTWQTDRAVEGTWDSVINTEVFKSVWYDVQKDGQYVNYDWVVKVDPDSVFFPDRLKDHLWALHAPREAPIYIKNTERDFGFLGAIEVFSKEAVDKLFWPGVIESCAQEVGEHSGEDGFMKGCMDMIGAGAMEDIDVLRTPAAEDCNDAARVCFHAFKDPGSWEGCYNAAAR